MGKVTSVFDEKKILITVMLNIIDQNPVPPYCGIGAKHGVWKASLNIYQTCWHDKD